MVRHIHLDECDSTQDEVERQLEAGEQGTLLISTSRQRHGRGRGANLWEHHAGALAFSFSAPPHPELTWQSIETSVLIAEWFEASGRKLQLKWPNDLYADGKKCGGILLKSSHGRMVIGVGVNLTPQERWGHAWGHLALPSDYARAFPRAITEHCLVRANRSSASLKKLWESRCTHLGAEVTITDGKTVHEGVFHGLGIHGEAVLRTSTGVRSVYNGTLRW
jgi:BirA family biotin operon repressor/biotin-[acetyl-CoA-carboxylase] ligase